MKSYQEPVSLEGGTFSTFTLGSSPYNNGRRRQKHNKTFSGCIVCKQRKVRCTEEKPSCARCVRTKAVCSYKPPTIWVFEPTDPATKQWSQPRLSTTPTEDSSLSLPDRRALFYYQERAVPIFSCFFGKDFWSSIVLQMSHHHVAIRDLTIGAAALFESVEAQTPDERLRLQTEFFSKYSKAVSTIATTSHELSPQMILTACAMFANFEMITGSIKQSMVHVKAGLKITQTHLKRLKQDGKAKSSEAVFIANLLQPNIAGHALQAHIYGASFLPMHEISKIVSEHYQMPHVPKKFTHIHEAFSSIAGIVHHIVLVDPSADRTWAGKHVHKLETLLDEWTDSFDRFEKILSISERSTRRLDIAILHCNHGLACIAVQALQQGLRWTDPADGSPPPESHVLREYIEMEIYLQDCIRGIDKLSVGTDTSDYTPPIIMVAVSATSDHRRTSALPIPDKANVANVRWSDQEALAVSKAIIFKGTSGGLAPAGLTLNKLNDRVVSSLHPYIASIEAVSVEHLRMPQQQSYIGLLIPRLPKYFIGDVDSTPCATCSWMPLESLPVQTPPDDLT